MKPSLVFALALAVADLGAVQAQAPTRGPNGQAALIAADSQSFWVDAPAGWVLDTAAGKSDHLPVVLYRSGQSWRDGAAVMYANASKPPRGVTPNVSDAIEADTTDWSQRVPDVVMSAGDSIRLVGRRAALVRKYVSLTEGHFEAVAYIAAADRVWLVVLSAHTRAAFTAAYPDFVKLVSTYEPGPPGRR